MKGLSRDAAEWTWYSIGLMLLALTAVLWASMEPGMIWQQQVVLGFLGALAGGAIAIAGGEWVRPSAANAQTPAAPSVKCEQSVGGVSGGVDPALFGGGARAA
jgi:hypothetical protein